jgi:retrograde regulation protein 2
LSLAAPNDIPLCSAVLQKLADALPKDLDQFCVPTLFSVGLGPIWVNELWSRQGYDTATNASFALHNVLVRDSNSPGLSHLARSIWAVASVARWGCIPEPIDADLFKSLRSVANSHHLETSFWARYLGVVSGILTTILPTASIDAQELSEAVTFKSHCSKDPANPLEVTISVSAKFSEGINLDELVDRFKFVSKKNGNKKSSRKVVARIAKT